MVKTADKDRLFQGQQAGHFQLTRRSTHARVCDGRRQAESLLPVPGATKLATLAASACLAIGATAWKALCRNYLSAAGKPGLE